MPPASLRHAARAVILDDTDRILLCRLTIPSQGVIWVAPGGGVEPGESMLAALRRELVEEVGLDLHTDPPHVWHQRVIAANHAPGYHGVVNDYFLVRTEPFTPRGAMTTDELAAEHITGWRWWTLPEISHYRGADLFSPRDLATPLFALLTQGTPVQPVELGL